MLDESTTTQTARQFSTQQLVTRQSTRTQTKVMTTRSLAPLNHQKDASQAWFIAYVTGGVLLGVTSFGLGLLVVRFCRQRVRYSGLVCVVTIGLFQW